MLDIIKDVVVGLFTNQIQKRLDKEKPQIVINNYFNIEKLEYLIIQKGQDALIKEKFAQIFNWLKGGEADKYIKEVGNGGSQPFSNYWDKLMKSDEITVGHMIDFFEKIKNGPLNWTIRESIGNKKVSKILEDIKDVIEVAEDKLFREDTQSKIIIENIELKEIQDKNLENINIGGIVAFLKTSTQLSNREILTPKFLGFKKVSNKNALVNLAIEGKISIIEVVLTDDNSPEYYLVKLKIKNNTNSIIEFEIPKGQIFENKDFETTYQNLTAANKECHTIEPLNESDINIYSLCLNEKLPPPSMEGTKGNITIYEIEDKIFITQRELWDKIIKNKDTLQYSKW